MRARSSFYNWNNGGISRQPDIYWSDSFQRWLCFGQNLINQILKDDSFKVHDFSTQELSSRFNLDLKVSSEILNLLPLAYEGNLHQELRRKFILEINKNQKNALKIFQHEIHSIAQLIQEKKQGDVFDFIDFLHPAIKRSHAAISGMPDIPDLDFSDISMMFDDKISIKKRLEINRYLSKVLDDFPPEMSREERIFHLALLAVGSSSLLGSISDSLLLTLKCYPKGNFKNLSLKRDLPASGISLVERIATEDSKISNITIYKDQRVQLFVESAGYQDKHLPEYSKTYFAASTRHVCPGMSYSLDVWRVFSETLSTLDIAYELLDFQYRIGDSVFNFPTSIRIKID